MYSAETTIFNDRLLDLGRHPQNMFVPEQYTDQLRVENTLCGDDCTLYLKREGGIIRQVCFSAKSCLLVRASASVLTGLVRDYSVDEAFILAGQALDFFRNSLPETNNLPEIFSLFSPLREFPTRSKCLALPWLSLYQLAQEGK